MLPFLPLTSGDIMFSEDEQASGVISKSTGNHTLESVRIFDAVGDLMYYARDTACFGREMLTENFRKLDQEGLKTRKVM